METIKLKILDEAGHTLMTCDADTAVSLVYTNEYHPGDRVALEIDHPGQYCVIQFEDTMPEALVYVVKREINFHIPFGEQAITAGTFFALMATGMNSFLIAQGFSGLGMATVMLGAVLNIVLDPIFIFVLHLDVAGAALATVLSQMASCAFVLCSLRRKRMPVRLRWGGFSWRCDFEGMEIALDCSNGSSSRTAEKLFTKLGAKVHMLFDEPDGVNINRDCGSTHMSKLQKYVREHKLSCGLAFDGDADRCLAVDENGNLVDGDYLIAICANDMKQRGVLKKNAVVGTIMTNMGFNKFCEENDMHFVSTKVGDRYVLEAMMQEGYNIGGEQSGHIILLDYATTGDGQLSGAMILSIMKRTGEKLSQLAKIMERLPQVLINVKVSREGKLSFYTDREIKAEIERVSEILGDRGRILVRVSGTEPLVRVMLEGENLEEIQNLAEEAAQVVRERLA